MSLILEALRKSEAERRRDSTPDVALELPPVPARAARGTPGWLWPVAIVAVAALALAGWLASRGDGSTGRAAESATTPAPVDTQLPQPPAPQVLPATPPVVAPPPAAIAPPSATAPTASAPAAVPPAPASPRPQPQPSPPPAPSPAAGMDAIPDIASTGLPPVKLSMHMWDATPSRRFVILDGQRLGEGERSGEWTVSEIRRDGVVVERNGQRARIPLP